MVTTRSSTRQTRSSTQRASACSQNIISFRRVSKRKPQQKATNRYGLVAIEEHNGQGRESQLTGTVLPSIEFPDTSTPRYLRDAFGRIHQPSPLAGPSRLSSIPETPQDVQPSSKTTPAIKRESRCPVPQTPGEKQLSSDRPILPGDYNFSPVREDSGELGRQDSNGFERGLTLRGFRLRHVPRTPARRNLEESLAYFYREKGEEVVIPKPRSWTYYGLLRVGYRQHRSSSQQDSFRMLRQEDSVFFPEFSTCDPVLFADWRSALLREEVVTYD